MQCKVSIDSITGPVFKIYSHNVNLCINDSDSTRTGQILGFLSNFTCLVHDIITRTQYQDIDSVIKK